VNNEARAAAVCCGSYVAALSAEKKSMKRGFSGGMVTMPGDDHDTEPSIRLPVVVLDAMHKIHTELQDDKAALLDDLQALAQERVSLQALWRTIGWWVAGGVVVLLALIIYEGYRDSHVKAFRYDLVHDVMTLFDEHGTVIRQEITACRPRVRW
jgi:hypothetical protein